MKITLEEGLSRLANNPQVAAEFDRCSPGISRREHVQSIINLIDATAAETAALKNKLSASRAKIAALEAAKITNARLKSQLVSSNIIFATAKAAPSPAKPSPALKGYDRAKEAFSRKTLPKSPITREAYQKLTPEERARYTKQGGKII